MRVLHLSTSDIEGGAARAAWRLHCALEAAGVASTMLVQRRHSDSASVIGPGGGLGKALALVRPQLDLLPLMLYRRRRRVPWSVGWCPNRVAPLIREAGPDVVNMHWVGSGFVPLWAMSGIGAPVVWTLHDMWPFTGGCHYDEGCQRFQQNCGRCPLLGSGARFDLTRIVLATKRRIWPRRAWRIVAPSQWLAGEARSSSLFDGCDVRVIPNGIDTALYRPLSKALAREILGLPREPRLILFGAVNATSDPRKGFVYLREAMRRIGQADGTTSAEVIVFGASHSATHADFGTRVHYLGVLHDDVALQVVYSAADVIVMPSIQESFGLTGLEAMACGTPVVGFAVGGMRDLVEHHRTGYLAEPYASEDLAAGIAWVLSSQERLRELGSRARLKVEREFEISHIASKYAELYEEVLGLADDMAQEHSSALPNPE